MSAFPDIRLPPLQRRLIFAALAIVVLSGIAWIGMGLRLDPLDFTNPLRAWRHRLLVLHAISAYALLWLVGTLFPHHQHGAWRARRNRVSGGALTGTLLALVVTGLTLYYPPHEGWRNALSLVHQGLGLALALLVPIHVTAGKHGRTFSPDISRVG
ncbi:MAG: hypothetical protein HYU77_08130 [Betaproteobacteria bacterium]|nr:hypothetical protein [Betaproteobacteria bacterium]